MPPPPCRVTPARYATPIADSRRSRPRRNVAERGDLRAPPGHVGDAARDLDEVGEQRHAPAAAAAASDLQRLADGATAGCASAVPVAAWIAFITAGVTTQIVGSPTPPQKS